MTLSILLLTILLLLTFSLQLSFHVQRSYSKIYYKPLEYVGFFKLNCYAESDSPGDSEYGATALDDNGTGVCGLDNNICELKDLLMKTCYNSNRGQNINDRSKVSSIVSQLVEQNNMKKDMIQSLLLGHWDLLYIDEDVTRSSPFFWAFRKAFKGIEDPLKLLGPTMLSESIFKITDEIPFKEIGECKQQFTSNELISKVIVKVSNLPFSSSSKMTTTSYWTTTSEEDIIEIRVEKTQVLDSTIGNLIKNTPLSTLIDTDIPFPSGNALELIKAGSSTVYMKILYIDEELRICQNIQDDKLLIFKRT
jgi:hypothetical protein